MRTTHAPQGFIAMVTVLVMMAVLLAIGLTVASIGRDEIALAGIVQDGDQAFSVADGCAEEAIDRLKGDSAYAGGTYSLAGGADDHRAGVGVAQRLHGVSLFWTADSQAEPV